MKNNKKGDYCVWPPEKIIFEQKNMHFPYSNGLKPFQHPFVLFTRSSRKGLLRQVQVKKPFFYQYNLRGRYVYVLYFIPVFVKKEAA
jgi:hypothetical protein